jgi:hypothetical protein
MLPHVGKILILVGGLTAVLGVILLYAGKIPLVGKLPGDIVVRREDFSLYFPMATSVIVSIVLTLLLNAFGDFFRK